jgi:hypothetical protein
MELTELAARWKITTAALRMAIGRGALKAERVGSGRHSVWLVTLPEVERYEKENQGKFGTASSRHPGTGGRPPKERGDGG